MERPSICYLGFVVPSLVVVGILRLQTAITCKADLMKEVLVFCKLENFEEVNCR